MDNLRDDLAKIIVAERAKYSIYRTATGEYAIQMVSPKYEVVHSGTFEDCDLFVSRKIADACIECLREHLERPEVIEKAARKAWEYIPRVVAWTEIDATSQQKNICDVRAAFSSILPERKA